MHRFGLQLRILLHCCLDRRGAMFWVGRAEGEEMARLKKEWPAPHQGLVTNHETGRVHLLSPSQLQEMRTRVGGSQTGYWPVAGAMLRQNKRAKM